MIMKAVMIYIVDVESKTMRKEKHQTLVHKRKTLDNSIIIYFIDITNLSR